MDSSTRRMGNGDFLTIDQLAELIHRSPNSLYVERHRRKGIGALAVLVGNKLLWRRADVDRWFDEQLRAGDAR